MLVLQHKKAIAGILAVILFLLLVLPSKGASLTHNALAMALLMVIFWIFEVVPIYATALIPLFLATPLGLLDSSDLAKSYGNTNVYLFLGGFILALALEKWKVHHQIASRILAVFGTTKSRVLLGFGLSAYLLSMWISNTATTLMMLPMALSIIQLQKEHTGRFPLLLMLTVAYASSIGGMATLVGSPPNTQMAATLAATYDLQITFIEWMKIGGPVSLLMLIALSIFFQYLLGKERNELVQNEIFKEKWTRPQKRVLILFGLVVFMWVFRTNIIDISGVEIKDATIAIFGAFLLFIIPSRKGSESLLEWQDTVRVPWGILVLFGGGIALALALDKSKLLIYLAEHSTFLNEWSLLFVLLTVIVISLFATELMSNLALVSVLVPLVAVLSIQMGYPILQLTIPLTLAASCAFMMPVSTPPNAIIFSSGKVSIAQMASIGFFLNIVGILILWMYCYFFMA
ncbi:MAG: SLC13 family permease [Crocinitomicaceae bacterium]|mgnify:CR=1 FL=1|tara:strand:- start:16821 stop:18197 length:1377 start_codon:yes stop_codon:yes gene_type:complete